MTDDIVARLNSSHAFLGDPLHKEAADNIERLRAALKLAQNLDEPLLREIERLQERRDDWSAAMTENHDLWRENKRLRLALEHYSCDWRDDWSAEMTENHNLWRENERLRLALEHYSCNCTAADHCPPSMLEDYDCGYIARTALEGKKTND